MKIYLAHMMEYEMLSTMGDKENNIILCVNQKPWNQPVEPLWTQGINTDQSIPALQETKIFPVLTTCCIYKSNKSFKNREAEKSSGRDLGFSWPLKNW